MQRLTGNQAYDLVEAYNSIYKSEQLTEEQIVESFNIWIDDLLNEGYDLSEYTYDDLYEYYLSEGPIPWGAIGKGLWNIGKGAVQATWKGTKKQTPEGLKNIPGAEQAAHQLLARLGGVGVNLGALGLGDQFFTGGRGRNWLGDRINDLRRAGHSGSVPSMPSLPSIPAVPPSPPSKPRNTYTFRPPESLTRPRNESYDAIDIVTAHLINEGYADDEYSAAAIIANMSDDWREQIFNLYSLNEG